ncbi:class I adenylate-forming enzyme family protein [Chelatococcus reniformis]|uniref:4-coumarate--CoA ligase n=1 Tax=Chelatococcus reniformis TaxID=1494448 RepID=A0A916UAE0_9HYPH|nr:AMP-binding protein [Chelatococcus reniformis]GGC65056.1 4-coumarate--CoA ligase [Chelatococcus reniformis]
MLDIPQNTLPDIWSYHACLAPAKRAIASGDEVLTWGEFGAQMNRMVHALTGLGLRKGDRVAFVMSNTVEHLVLLCGAMKAGACVVPLSTLLAPEQIAGLINDSGALWLFTDPGFAGVIRTIRERLVTVRPGGVFSSGDEEGCGSTEALLAQASSAEPGVALHLDDLMNISYSSGTTGLPKGVAYSHRARQIMGLTYAIPMKFGPTARTLLTTPIYSNGTWITLWPALLSGGEIEIMPSFAVGPCLELIEARRITHTFMVPTQYIRILEDPAFRRADLGSLRMCLTAGSAMGTDVKRRIQDQLGPCLHELYGYSEGGATIITPEEMAERPASVGRPNPGFDIRILDQHDRDAPRGEAGEIAFYGGWAMRGYHGNREQTEAAIWRDQRGRTFIRSGDVGRLDADGYLYVVDRKKDMIISGGFNIYPSDIEAVLSAHPDVIEATVVGVPHPTWGETPVGFVILRGDAAPESEALKAWANERLAKTQRLAKVVPLDEFPRNALGKVVKRELRDRPEIK